MCRNAGWNSSHFLVVIQLLGAICLFYGAWLGLSSRASARHRTASNTLCPVKVFSSGRYRGLGICLSGVLTQKNRYFPSVRRRLQSAAKGPDISRTQRFTRFLASFTNERFASEDMTAFSGQSLRGDAWWHQEVGHGRYQARHHERIQRIGRHKRVQDPTINLQHPQSIFVHHDSPLSK